MTYVNGFLLAVPNANKQKYIEMAENAAKIFRSNGALSFVETWGSDVPDGKLTSFPLAVKLKDDESVVFSWITWPDKQLSETGMASAMKEFDELDVMSTMPYDGLRMMWGGFETIVEA